MFLTFVVADGLMPRTGMRTANINFFCNPLIFNIMQNNYVRGPYFFEGTANNDIL